MMCVTELFKGYGIECEYCEDRELLNSK
jgi:hypothetical protein